MSQGTRDEAKEQRSKTRKVLRTMKLALNLTFEDGMKVVEAIKETAIENGWDAEELDECGVIDSYSRVVDAALAAMGISVSIAGEPEVEDYDDDFDDEEWDEDEENGYFNSDYDDDTTTYSLTAKGEFVVRYMNAGYTFEDACEIADILFGEGE